MRRALLLLVAGACSGSREEAGRTPRPEPATPPVAEAPREADPTVQRRPEPPEPADEAALLAAVPALAALDGRPRALALTALDLVPSPCAGACGGRSAGACAVNPPPECANTRGIARHAARLAPAAEALDPLVRALSWPEPWFPTDPLDPAAAVPVELWLDPGRPFVATALDAARAILDPPRVTVRLRAAPGADAELAAAMIAADLQGRGLDWLAALVAAPAAGGSSARARAAAEAAGLDLESWEADRAGPAAGRVRADAALAARIGVRASPSWTVAGYRLRGARSRASLRTAVERAMGERPLDEEPAP